MINDVFNGLVFQIIDHIFILFFTITPKLLPFH